MWQKNEYTALSLDLTRLLNQYEIDSFYKKRDLNPKDHIIQVREARSYLYNRVSFKSTE